MHFVLIIMVIIGYNIVCIEKSAGRASQVVWKYQRGSRTEKGWETLRQKVRPSAKPSLLKVASEPN